MPPFKDGKFVQDSDDERQRKIEVVKGIHKEELAKAAAARLQKEKDAGEAARTTEPDKITPEPKISFISRMWRKFIGFWG